MAGRIKDEDIALVRERAPIADVVGEYLQLRNAGGGSLKGLCPFHDEKSPSFNVTPSKNLWYCFGCGEGGDVISFVQQIDGLGFTEAVESLARQSGITLRYESSEGRSTRRDQNKRQRLLEAHKAAAEFYAQHLFRSAEGVVARRFLSERGFVGPHAEHFGLGYAPPGWENLVGHLRRKGFSDQELVEGGLASQGRRGAYDRFRNRVIWPIREVTGEVVGFGARKLDPDEDGPKYLNSPESPIFHKGRILYGLDLAKRQISRQSKAIVVEGYTDVMACHLAGEDTAVATCGTSFGEDHVKILRRMLLGRSNQGGRVVFTFDGDKAGQKAAARAFTEEHGFSSETYVAIQPDGLDPGDLWLEQGAQSITDLVDSAVPLYEFKIKDVIEGYDLETPEGRIAALDAAAPVVASIRDAGVRQGWGKNLDRWLGLMDESFVMRRVKQHMNRSGGGRGGAHRQTPPRPVPGPEASQDSYDLRDPSVQRERQALKLALRHPALVPGFDRFTEEDFTAPPHREILALIGKHGGVGAAVREPAGWIHRLLDDLPGEDRRNFLTRLVNEPLEFYGELDEHFAQQILNTVSFHSIGRKKTNLLSRLQRLDPGTQAEEIDGVLGQLQELDRKKRAFQEE